MKLKKYGYTLTEVLLALAIVGVISVILIPNFATNAMKSRSAATLGRAVRQIESGAMAIIQNFNENTLNNGNANDNGSGSISYTDSLSVALNSTAGITGQIHTLGLAQNTSCKNPSIFEFNSQNVYNPGNDFTCYKFTKFQAEVYMNNIKPVNLGNATQPISDIYIDTNGFRKRPNQLGKDIFWFTLFDNAKMVPHGAISDMSNDTAVNASHLGTCTEGNVGDGTTCAASVVADGFKITYY